MFLSYELASGIRRNAAQLKPSDPFVRDPVASLGHTASRRWPAFVGHRRASGMIRPVQRAATRILSTLIASRRGRLALIAMFATLVAVAGLVQLPPIDRDEARFAQATAQMLETGDFVTVRYLNGERNKKPAGIYWLQATGVAMTSSPEARAIRAFRLPSVLSVVLASVFVALAGDRLFGAGPGLLAGLLIAASPIVAAEASLAKTDAALLAATAGAMVAFVEIIARTADGKPVPKIFATLFWIAISAGALIKGPVIFLVAGPAVLLCAWRFRFIDLLTAMRPVTGLAILLAATLPWAIAVSITTDGRFLAEAVGDDMLAKLARAQEGHVGPPGYHLLLLAPLMWPAAPLIADGVWRTFQGRDKWRWFLLAAWTAPAWLIFEATATKLPHYPLPTYPAIAIAAAAAALEKRTDPAPSWRRRWGAWGYAGIGLAFALAIGSAPFAGRVAAWVDGGATPAFTATLQPLTAIGLALLLVAGTFWVARDYVRGPTWRPALAACALSCALVWTIGTIVLPGLSPVTLSTRLAAEIDAADRHAIQDGAPGTILVGYAEPSAVFLLGSQTVLLSPEAAALEAESRSGGTVVIEDRQRAAFDASVREGTMSLTQIGRLDDLNYSKGRRVGLTIYAID